LGEVGSPINFRTDAGSTTALAIAEADSSDSPKASVNFSASVVLDLA
jgi:hypothetical protein